VFILFICIDYFSVYLCHFICCGIPYIELDLVIDSVVISDSISPVFRCQLLVTSYQLSDISFQLFSYQLLFTSSVVGDIRSLFHFNNNLYCFLLIKDIITQGTGVIAW